MLPERVSTIMRRYRPPARRAAHHAATIELFVICPLLRAFYRGRTSRGYGQPEPIGCDLTVANAAPKRKCGADGERGQGHGGVEWGAEVAHDMQPVGEGHEGKHYRDEQRPGAIPHIVQAS